MPATGRSLIEAIRIFEREKPKKIVILAAIAAKPGIERLLEYNNAIQIIAGVVNPGLNDRGFIIPGLGGDGDRCYGEKHISTYR